MRKSLLLSSLGMSFSLLAVAPAMAASDQKPATKPAVAEAAAPAAPQPKIHVVGDGDSLSSIAEAEQLPSWRPLWDANAEVQNPDLVYQGEKLVVPTQPVPERPLPADMQQPVTYSAPVNNGYVAPVRHTAANYSSGAGGWAAGVRQRESGGNYATNTGNGYYGAYQFTLGTWQSVGGTGLPSNASPAEQDMRAQMLYNQRGCSPWPNTCR